MKGENATTRFAAFFRLCAVARGQDESGSVLVEFSIVAPMLVLVWVGVLQFCPILQNRVILQGVVSQGAQTMSAGRTDSSIYTDTIDQVKAAAGPLWAQMTVTMSVCNAGGASCSACSTDSACYALMQSAQGDAAQVSATYPCVLTYSLFNLRSNCTISATDSTLIQ
jgi:Flp pilus assembly protein TadG